MIARAVQVAARVGAGAIRFWRWFCKPLPPCPHVPEGEPECRQCFLDRQW